jgi:hypothetical protein
MVYPSMVKAKDPVTNNIVLQILTDGIEYEDDLQAVIKDIGLLQSNKSCSISYKMRDMNG